MVVQCTTCQSKFRIADDKVTDRGVRVRCTSCKNVFQVKKPGATTEDLAAGAGHTMDLSSLGAAAVSRPPTGPHGTVARPPTGPQRPQARPPTGPQRPEARPPTGPQRADRPPTGPQRTDRPPTGPQRADRPPTGPQRPRSAPPAARPAPLGSAPPRAGANGAARRLQADDLFGMAELTGDSPLGDGASRADQQAPPAAPSMPNFDDIDIDLDPPHAHSRPPSSKVSRPPPVPPPAQEPAQSSDDFAAGTDMPGPSQGGEADDSFGESGAVASQAQSMGEAGAGEADPFAGMNLGESQSPSAASAAGLALQPRDENPPPEPPAPSPEAPPLPESPGREMVSSALTGLVGAALAVAVVVVAALSDDASAGWLGLGRGNEVVATRVVSGLYDTASGKPVFFVRGRVENRGKKVRGPIHVTADLIGDGAEVRAEAVAGAEPTAEEVWSLRSQADVDKLNRELQVTPVERKLSPGKSLPFFALFADPPADLPRHRLHLNVESVDAWIPPTPKAGKGR